MAASAITGSQTTTSWATVLTPCGVAIRTSRTPGWASTATVKRTVSFSRVGFFARSSGLTGGRTTSAVTPVPLTSTWYAPYIEYRELTVTSLDCPTCTATGFRLISIGKAVSAQRRPSNCDIAAVTKKTADRIAR